MFSNLFRRPPTSAKPPNPSGEGIIGSLDLLHIDQFPDRFLIWMLDGSPSHQSPGRTRCFWELQKKNTGLLQTIHDIMCRYMQFENIYNLYISIIPENGHHFPLPTWMCITLTKWLITASYVNIYIYTYIWTYHQLYGLLNPFTKCMGCPPKSRTTKPISTTPGHPSSLRATKA